MYIVKKRNYRIWWGYIYQRIISLFIYLIKNTENNILKDEKSGKISVWLYKTLNELKRFIHEFIWDNDYDIYLEWDLKCFEDINFLAQDDRWDEYYIFIQVKWWRISRKEFFKILNNFYENINFQENYENKNYKFIIVSQYPLNNNLKSIFMKYNTESYLNFIIDNYFKYKRIESATVSKRKEILNKILLEKSFKNIEFRKKDIFMNYYKKFKYVFDNIKLFENINLFEIEWKLVSFYWKDNEFSSELNRLINIATSKDEKNPLEIDTYRKYKKIYFKYSKKTKTWTKSKLLEFKDNEWGFIS